ncbi:MAG TPA: adenylate/guanylate cyclase domain-containing protein [Thermoanaerobaculia bacterium]|nr:adenylate/guanylate cyclase domain-containing protein [Thermoanaerobaculia bacterium]
MMNENDMALPSKFKEHQTVVLLVDDQPMIGEAVRRMLDGEPDVVFHYCSDPTTALAMAASIKPTVILQDLVMPQIDGLTLVRYFRANPFTRETPLIVLSTKEEPKTKADAFAFGANDYMVKLPDKLELIARIRYHSRGYINLLERNEAFHALMESQAQLEVRNRFIRETFGRYLSDEIVNRLLETPEGLNLGGEKRKVTIMMTDLRGFTSMSERLSPEQVLAVINNFLETMTEIIVKHQGTIDEFIGDAILVIFGAPIRRDDDAERAVVCAVEMQLAMEEVNARNHAAGLPKVEMGIGLNTGEVVVGNIGSKRRAKYGVVGSNVNITSRIESYTLGEQILMSESTKDEVADIAEIEGEIEALVKGMRLPIRMYELRGIGGKYNLHLTRTEFPLVRLPRELPIRYSILEGTRATGAWSAGSIVSLGGREAELVGEAVVNPLTNVQIQFVTGEADRRGSFAYCKVLPRATQLESGFIVRFTSLPDACEKILEDAVKGVQG